MWPDDPLCREVLDQVDDGIYFVDPQRRIIMWNKASERITGYSAVEVIGRRCADNILMHVDECGKCLCLQGCPLSACMADGNRRTAKLFLHHKDGHRVPVHVSAAPVRDGHGKTIGAVETFRDESTRLAELDRIRELEQMAFLDPLTGVANRRFFESSLQARLAEFRRDGTPFGILMVDIDKFKRLNDLYGHSVGDKVLRMVAATMTAVSRPFDLVARLGGEEFVVIVAKAAPDQLEPVANRFRIMVAKSGLKTRGDPLSVTVSIGATLVHSTDDEKSVLNRADSLLYAAKEAGRDCIVSDQTPRFTSHLTASAQHPTPL